MTQPTAGIEQHDDRASFRLVEDRTRTLIGICARTACGPTGSATV